MDLVAILAQGTVAIIVGVVALLAVFALARARRAHPSAHVDARDRSNVDPTLLSDVRGDDARLGSELAAADLRAARHRAIDDLQRRLIRTQRGGPWTT